MAQILDGTKVSRDIREEVKSRVYSMISSGNRPPGLAVILVGDDPASRVYVNSKKKACETAGIIFTDVHLPSDTDQKSLLNYIDSFNADSAIDGILLQLPLPRHLNPIVAINSVNPAKDVDGLHPVNIGKLVIGDQGFLPCTPFGVIELLKRNNLSVSGMNALVIGRSNIVGKPMIHLLMRENATVTVAHSKTAGLVEHAEHSDLIVAALGKPRFVKGEWLKPGCIVIDIGTNSVSNPSDPTKRMLIGDVEYETAASVASWITPVPGGVGPMTIAMLLRNTLTAYELNLK